MDVRLGLLGDPGEVILNPLPLNAQSVSAGSTAPSSISSAWLPIPATRPPDQILPALPSVQGCFLLL